MRSRIRVWDPIQNKMLNFKDYQGLEFVYLEKDGTITYNSDSFFEYGILLKNWIQKNGFILMHCLDLKDKDYKQIYIGDLVMTRKGIKEVDWFSDDIILFIMEREKCKVIGNIYKNPNLLKQKQ